MRLTLITFLCVILASCAAPGGGVSSNFQLDPAGKSGLVAGTITYDSFTGRYSVGWSAREDQPGYTASVGYSMWPPLGPEYDDALKAKGGTFAVEVPAGEYTLRKWFIRQGAITYSAANTIGLPFVVEAGKVTYLGNFHFHKSDEVSLEDRAARDIPVLKTRIAAIRSAPIAMSIGKGMSLQAIGGGRNKEIDFSTYTPVFIRTK